MIQLKKGEVFRRRYVCPECGHNGRCNQDRQEPLCACSVCRTVIALQVQREDGIYEKKANNRYDPIEFYI